MADRWLQVTWLQRPAMPANKTLKCADVMAAAKAFVEKDTSASHQPLAMVGVKGSDQKSGVVFFLSSAARRPGSGVPKKRALTGLPTKAQRKETVSALS